MKKINVISIILGIIAIVSSIAFLPKTLSSVRNFIIVISIIVMIIPTVIFYSSETKKQKEKDQKFLEFIRDITEGVKSGTPITQSIINLGGRSYGALTPHIAKIINQISIGIPLNSILETFARDTKSPLISRSVSLISEANRSGGELNTILNSVVSSVNQTEIIHKERRASIFNLIVQGYIIFFVFILIVLALEFFLMPLMEGIDPVKDLNSDINMSTENNSFSTPLLFLLITQSLFSGLVIGKLAEGNITAGIKHSFILVSLALVLSTLAHVIF